MNIVNLTPHEIKLIVKKSFGSVTHTIPTSGTIARVSQSIDYIKDGPGDIPLYKSTFGQVENLPDEVEGTLLIVSSIVKSAMPDRKDLVVPVNFVRDADGKIIGAGGLSF